MNVQIHPAHVFAGEVQVPGDKSISHRALLISSMAQGLSEIPGALTEGDCDSTIQCLRQLGVDISEEHDGRLCVRGKGRCGFQEPEQILDADNSGTTVRLLMGILAGQGFSTVLTGDRSLRERPMGRVTAPLKQMGAVIVGRAEDGKLPLAIRGGGIQALDQYPIPVPSAQVKSALLLAGCYAVGKHSIVEKTLTRDHTEILLSSLGVQVDRKDRELVMKGGQEPSPGRIRVPGDFSSAAFLIGAALLIPNSELQVRKVGLNPTRTGFLDTVADMGGQFMVSNEEVWNGERVGDITVMGSLLHGTAIPPDRIPRMIDELPILAVLAAYADGETEIRGAEELRYKESDRIRAMAAELKKMGAGIAEIEDGLVIQGKETLKGGLLFSHGDHRVAMALAVAGIRASDHSTIMDADCVGVSFPKYFQMLRDLSR